MKFRKPKPVITTKIVDVELSNYIQEQDVIYRDRHLKTSTKLSTLDFKSIPSTSRIRDFIGSLMSDYQHLIDFTNNRLSGDLQKLQGQSHISDMEDEAADLDRKIGDVQDKLAPKKGKFDDQGKRHKTEVTRWFGLFVPLLVIIAGMELIANFDSLNVGGSRISSLGIAVLAGICVYWWAHFSPEKILKYGGKSIRKQVLLFFLFLTPIVVVFYFFSYMRLQYLSALNPELAEMYNTSPLLMTLINAFAYTISCWIIAAYKPDKETILAYKKYKNDLREIGQLVAELETLKTQKAALNPTLRGKLTDKYNILLLGKQTEQEIVTRLRGCFEEFKMELFLQTNGACAMLFTGNPDQDIPKLNLNYQNIDKKFEDQ